MVSRPKKVAGRTVPASEFKARCLVLMDEVEARHSEIVVTKHGRPVAKLVPVHQTPPDPFGFLAGTVLAEEDIVSADHHAWAESGSDPLGR